MIVGIDEVGNFDPNSDQYNYFVSALIDQNERKYAIKKSQFNLWESKIPKENKDKKGEVKGQLLSNNQLEEFYNEVLKPKPNLLYSVVRIKPNENTTETIEKHQQREVEDIEQVLEQYKTNPKGNWKNWYERILAWYKNRKYAHLLKMKSLQHLLGLTFNYGIGWAQLTYILDKKDDTNIKNFSFKIDKDFIRADNVKIMWNELLRQFWQEFSKHDKLPLVDFGLKEENPVKKEYGFDDRHSNLKKVVRDRTNFLNSEEHFEIRIADILGTIIHRYQNKGQCGEIYGEIEKHLSSKKRNFSHLILNEDVE